MPFAPLAGFKRLYAVCYKRDNDLAYAFIKGRLKLEFLGPSQVFRIGAEWRPARAIMASYRITHFFTGLSFCNLSYTSVVCQVVNSDYSTGTTRIVPRKRPSADLETPKELRGRLRGLYRRRSEVVDMIHFLEHYEPEGRRRVGSRRQPRAGKAVT